jgi:hypothetical protein
VICPKRTADLAAKLLTFAQKEARPLARRDFYNMLRTESEQVLQFALKHAVDAGMLVRIGAGCRIQYAIPGTIRGENQEG